MNRSRLLAATFATVLALIVAGYDRHVTAQSRPNVVLIMVDDLNVAMLRTMVAKGMMPNVKTHFVDAGYDFTSSFVTRAMGGPSRATSLTGLYAHNHGVLGHLNETNGGISRFNASSTVATWLRTSGYRTGYVGKYLPGYGTWTAPTYVPPGWDDWTGVLEPHNHSMDDYSLNYNGFVIDFGPLYQQYGDTFHQTNILTVQAGAFIRSAPQYSRPFFLYVAPTAVNMELPFQNECPDPTASLWGGNFWGATSRPAPRHLNTIFGNSTDFPLPTNPDFNEEDVTDKPDWVQQNPMLTAEDVDCLQKNYWRRLETLRSVDDLVGYVVQSLQSTGAMSNTVLLLTSDNGVYFGEHRLGEKSSAYEASIRVPLYVRAPWTNVPRQVAQPVLNNDLAPTIAQLAGVTPWHAVDGRSIVPLLQNPNLTSWRKIFLIEHWFEVPVPVTTAPTMFAVRTGASTRPRMYATYPTETTGVTSELYDLTLDPYELQNVVLDPAREAEITRLSQWMNALRSCRGVLGCFATENLFSF